MSRKDYIQFAAMLAKLRTHYSVFVTLGATLPVLDDVERELIDIFAADNVNFDAARFSKAASNLY